MSKEKKQQKLVPRLRFPEFRDSGEWSESILTGLCDVNPGHDGLPESFYYIDLESVEAGELLSVRHIDRESAPSRAQRYLRNGDIIFQTVRPYQRNNLLFDLGGEDDYVASTGYAQLRARENVGFLYQLVHTDSFVQRVLAKCTGSNYPAINSSDLAALSVWIPPEPAEQKKIADCLGSLDDLIAAEGRKLAALRDHKKGLMQQLFPREGKTVPRLRFPEFRNAGEWQSTRLVDVLKFQPGYPFPSSGFNEVGIGLRLIKNRDLRSDDAVIYYSSSFDEEFVVNDGDVLVGMDGDFTPCVWNRGQALLNQRVGRIIPKAKNDLRFLRYFLTVHLKDIEEATPRTTVKHLSHSDVERLHKALPEPAEQQKIADCLSALDDLIAAQEAKLDALRTHKRGLMQQLFPSPEDIIS